MAMAWGGGVRECARERRGRGLLVASWRYWVEPTNSVCSKTYVVVYKTIQNYTPSIIWLFRQNIVAQTAVLVRSSWRGIHVPQRQPPTTTSKHSCTLTGEREQKADSPIPGGVRPPSKQDCSRRRPPPNAIAPGPRTAPGTWTNQIGQTVDTHQSKSVNRISSRIENQRRKKIQTGRKEGNELS